MIMTYIAYSSQGTESSIEMTDLVAKTQSLIPVFACLSHK